MMLNRFLLYPLIMNYHISVFLQLCHQTCHMHSCKISQNPCFAYKLEHGEEMASPWLFPSGINGFCIKGIMSYALHKIFTIVYITLIEDSGKAYVTFHKQSITIYNKHLHLLYLSTWEQGNLQKVLHLHLSLHKMFPKLIIIQICKKIHICLLSIYKAQSDNGKTNF